MQGSREKICMAKRYEKAGYQALKYVCIVGIFVFMVAMTILAFTPKEPVSTSLPLPKDPWEYLTTCSCDNATYCLSDEDYIHIIAYNEALKAR